MCDSVGLGATACTSTALQALVEEWVVVDAG